ncbi:LPXTG cell wall anchor domain-containing protein [Streptomyces sp. N2-109]|uniref:LPXTG cell wall anchor domain-containing protein n=1 Tax=Streptomyces gossypii TaxID=2883101 RepID=A0ABT2K142_9ACTN|nr:LPXTG cell wall anchor domain-containing protein [Streptomyces gossypii]MCT2593885.1 LPXTG cell wall anchor domain-containing protein [Streptomyces gossypii]
MTQHTGHSPLTRRAGVAGAFAALLLATAGQAHAKDTPAPPRAPAAFELAEARKAVTATESDKVLARFFARDGAVSRSAADPKAQGATVPVYFLSADFVRGDTGAPVAELEFLATRTTSSDGQVASVWTAATDGAWRVVNIATGDDETAFAAKGARKAAGGTVFREPQIDAWYVLDGDRVLPLDAHARKAVGTRGTTVDAYRQRVHEAYGDKLPGSGYDRKGSAGGFGPQKAPAAGAEQPARTAAASTSPSTGEVTPTLLTGAGAVTAAAAAGAWLLRRRGRGSTA